MNNNEAQISGEHIDPLNPESHEPNPIPPSSDPSFFLKLPNGEKSKVRTNELQKLARVDVEDCYIVSTGHGTSGPFVFSGVPLLRLIETFLKPKDGWNQVEVISVDGFGTRIMRQELIHQEKSRPIILADSCNHLPLTRDQGLVRLIVPSERDDALKQVKWVAEVNIVD